MSGLFGDKVAQGDVAAHKEIHISGLFGDMVAHGDMADHKEIHMVVYLERWWWLVKRYST